MIESRWRRLLLFVLIFLSGASGLVYQVVWHKYLAILLGAQARATAIVLALFLGGISIGYATFGRWSRYKPWNLLFVYALVELGMAVWAILFPHLFHLAMPVTASLYGTLGVNSILIDFIMATLLIGPPTFLMGGTLPLLTQGLSDDLEQASRTHALIYGVNTLGACLGCLATGYLLIPILGLPAASATGGLGNLLVALISYFAFARHSSRQEGAEAPKWFRSFEFTRRQLGLLAIGFFSGFYLISLETVLIRLMGLSTGSSNYNFTLIVAIFILGLGIGSMLARRISNYGLARLFWNQIGVAIALALVYRSGDYWAYWVHVIRALLRDLPQGFWVYQAALAMGFTALLIIPIGLSGLTLPLCFHLMKDSKESLGERVGQLYGLNTVGCVVGALFGGYLILNWIDLDQLFKVCIYLSLVTVAVSAYLYVNEDEPSPRVLSFASGLMALTVMGLFLSPSWDRYNFIQPFRHPMPIEDVTFEGRAAFAKYLSRTTDYLFYKDGPNTSVGIGASKYQGKEVSRTIFVNGKSDGNTRGDYFTTIMLAHIPAILAEKIDRAFVIGFGTGITVGALGQYPLIQSVDVAEISNFSIANANYFDAYNWNVSTNPKVKFHEMDAFRFLQGSKDKYDIIVSEPSNPWVTGIENLYSAEFYGIAIDKMTEAGMFVQWIHTYSFNDDLLRMVYRTMSTKFPYVSVWQLKGGDLALVGKRQAFTKSDLVRAASRIESTPFAKRNLQEAGVDRIETMLALEIVPSPIPKLLGEGLPEHRLESPRLSNSAARAFFVNSSARVQIARRQIKEFYAGLDNSLLGIWLDRQSPNAQLLESLQKAYCDNPISKTNFLCEEVLAMTKLMKQEFQGDSRYDDVVSSRDIASLNLFHRRFPSGKFGPEDLQAVHGMFELYKKFASPIARVPKGVFTQPLESCLATSAGPNSLYGECLLQKILIYESLAPSEPEFQASVSRFLDWFPTVPNTVPNYAKLEEARSILAKMVSTPGLR